MAVVPDSAKQEKIFREIKRRYEAGELSPQEQEQAKAFLVQFVQQRKRMAEQGDEAPDPTEPQIEEIETEGLPQRREPGIVDQARATATGMDTFMDMAINQAQDPQNPRSILQRYDQLKNLPEIQSLRLGGEEELNMGKAFLADIGMQELQGKEAEIRKLRRAQSTIREAAGALSDTKNLEKVIKNQLGPYGVETQTVGGSVYMRFKDPVTGKTVESWANRPGFSLNDIPSADEVLAGVGAFVGGGGLLRAGAKGIKAASQRLAQRSARRDARLTRAPDGKFTSRRSQRRRQEEAQDQRIAQQQVRVQPGQRAPAPSRGVTGRVPAQQPAGTSATQQVDDIMADLVAPPTRASAARSPRKGVGTQKQGVAATAREQAAMTAKGIAENGILANFGVTPASMFASFASGQPAPMILKAGQRAWARKRMLRRATSTK